MCVLVLQVVAVFTELKEAPDLLFAGMPAEWVFCSHVCVQSGCAAIKVCVQSGCSALTSVCRVGALLSRLCAEWEQGRGDRVWVGMGMDVRMCMWVLICLVCWRGGGGVLVSVGVGVRVGACGCVGVGVFLMHLYDMV